MFNPMMRKGFNSSLGQHLYTKLRITFSNKLQVTKILKNKTKVKV